MGNWKTVRVVGECPEAIEQQKLQAALSVGFIDERWDCLCSGGLCGLPNFGGRREFDVTGNLGERGYDAESVAEHLRKLIEVAPSLQCMIHCGGEYETTDCIATVVCVDGKVEVIPPQIEISEKSHGYRLSATCSSHYWVAVHNEVQRVPR